MTVPLSVSFVELDAQAFPDAAGAVVVFADAEGKLGTPARQVNRVTRGAVDRAVKSAGWEKVEACAGLVIPAPAGLAAEMLLVVKQPDDLPTRAMRKMGAWIAKTAPGKALTIVSSRVRRPEEIAFGIMLRAYEFDLYKKKPEDAAPAERPSVTMMVAKPQEAAAAYPALRAVAEGVFFTRDLVNEPANVLTTTEFADRLKALTEIGVEVEVLDEAEMEELGMGMLLGVGQGSESPSKLVVMKWMGGGDEAPLALVGKGVVFDTGGISLKPAGGMEEMTMDMGGAGVVSGVMRAVALRQARANVVGLVGLVENMPDGKAQRPGDIVTSMKGDTVEIINTDAEGRLVLGDVLWYAQERFKPAGMINLATLTGAIIVGLGHDNAGVFSNNDAFANDFLKAANQEGEGAWRMPMGPSYDKLLKSRLADMKNTGGRAAGSITAAQFLGRFVKDETPWCHLDIAGVTLPPAETELAPKGATGWGVRALDRLIRNRFETPEA